MDYELAKQLKDAGFPQLTIPAGKGDYDMHEDDASGATLAYFPTLEELIEACGETFHELAREHDEWLASTWTIGPAVGATPIEAVAKLWLALNN